MSTDENKTRVTIVVPAVGDFETLEACLGPLVEEVHSRGADDEIIVVDDSGGEKHDATDLSQLVGERFGELSVIVREINGGLAAAALDGGAGGQRAAHVPDPAGRARPARVPPAPGRGARGHERLRGLAARAHGRRPRADPGL